MKKQGFTLIELLVVVAILAILAAIALPNFLEAQTRAKVASAKANLRTAVIGLEAYAVDHNRYPLTASRFPVDQLGVFADVQLQCLLKPVMYAGSADGFRDPFAQEAAQRYTRTLDDYRCATHQPNPGRALLYFSFEALAADRGHTWLSRSGGALISIGPDRADSFAVYRPFSPPELRLLFPLASPAPHPVDMTYDPTNGTTSSGDIAEFVGEGRRFAQP